MLHLYLSYFCALQSPPLVAERKAALFTSLAELRREPTPAGRDAVLYAIADLEQCQINDAPPDGRWALIFSTQATPPDPNRRGDSPLQPLIDATYATFFKFAPQLAGAQQDGGARGGGNNEQSLSLTTGIVENRVRIPLPSQIGGSLEIFVDGEVEVGEAADELRVTFSECSFRLRERGAAAASGREGALRVPLPRPVGALRTTHCDDELRVSRGGRGGVFVLRRLKGAPPLS